MSTDDTINVADLIARFGGIPAVAAELDVPASTIRNWVLQNEIPSDQVALLRETAQSRNLDLSGASETTRRVLQDPPEIIDVEVFEVTDDGPVEPEPTHESAVIDPDRDKLTEPAAATVGESDFIFEQQPEQDPAPVDVTAEDDAVPLTATGGQTVPEPARASSSTPSSPERSTPPPLAEPQGLMRQLSTSNGGAKPITMIGLFAALVAVGAFAWFAVIDTRAARDRDEIAEAARLAEATAAEEPAGAASETSDSAPATPATTDAPAPQAPAADAQSDGPEGAQVDEAAANTEAGATPDTASETVGDPAADGDGAAGEDGVILEETVTGVDPAVDTVAAATTEAPDAADAAADVDATDGGADEAVPATVLSAEALGQLLLLSDAIGELRAGQAANAQTVDDLQIQVDQLQTTVETLAGAWGEQIATTGRLYSLAPMVGEIQAALAQGIAYQATIDRIEFIAGDDDGLASVLRPLKRSADGRLLSDEAVANSFYRLMPQLRTRARILAADSFFGRLMARLASVVTVGRAPSEAELANLERPPDNQDSPAIMIRQIQYLLSRGDLDAAIAAGDRLIAHTGEGDLPEAFGDWLDNAKARSKANSAAAELEVFILQSISALSPG